MGSRFLFADPSFTAGAASAFDLGGTLFEFNQSLTPEQADCYALRQDWRAVGEAILAAATAFRASKDAEANDRSTR